LPVADHVRHVGTPAGLEGLFGNVFLDLADGHGAEAAPRVEAVAVEGAGAFA